MTMLKYILYWFLFFLLFYAESISFGAFTLSQLWKIPLVIYLLIYAVTKKCHFGFVVSGLLYALIQLMNADILVEPTTAIIRCARFANMPLLFVYMYHNLTKPYQVRHLLLVVSQFFILSTIPYFAGILHQKEIDLVFGNTIGFMGFFQNLHAASITLSISTIVVAFFLKEERMPKIHRYYNTALLLLGVYCVYATFVRTGMLMLLIGMLILFFPKQLRIKDVAVGTCITIVLLGFFYNQFQTNEDFKNRILDNNEQIDLNHAGSGRVDFLHYGLETYKKNDSVYAHLFGIGAINAIAATYSRFGLSIGFHNGFIDALVMNGLVGLLLIIILCLTMLQYIRQRKRAYMYKLLLAFFFCYLSCMFTQGNIGFPFDFYTALLLCALNVDIN